MRSGTGEGKDQGKVAKQSRFRQVHTSLKLHLKIFVIHQFINSFYMTYCVYRIYRKGTYCKIFQEEFVFRVL